jgi:hypothetical protein
MPRGGTKIGHIAHPLLRSRNLQRWAATHPFAHRRAERSLLTYPLSQDWIAGCMRSRGVLIMGTILRRRLLESVCRGLMKLMLIASKMPQSPAGGALVIHRRAGAVGLLAQAASRSDGRPSDRRITALCFRRRLCGGRSNMSLQHAACPTDPICLYRCR